MIARWMEACREMVFKLIHIYFSQKKPVARICVCTMTMMIITSKKKNKERRPKA
jgi:hypothetical protein